MLECRNAIKDEGTSAIFGGGTPSPFLYLSEHAPRAPREQNSSRAEQGAESRLQFINTFRRLRTISVCFTQYQFCTPNKLTSKTWNARNDLTFQRRPAPQREHTLDPLLLVAFSGIHKSRRPPRNLSQPHSLSASQLTGAPTTHRSRQELTRLYNYPLSERGSLRAFMSEQRARRLTSGTTTEDSEAIEPRANHEEMH